MDLPNLLSKLKNNQEEVEQFLAIEISPGTIKTAVWQVHNNKSEIISVGSMQLWQSESAQDIANAISKSLVRTTSNEEISKAIFGLQESWVAGDGIAGDKKTLLKEICQQVKIKPLGFVVTSESIVHFLRDQEGGPPSAVLIQVSSNEITVSIARLGRIQGSQTVGRSQHISQDVEEGLARFPTADSMPSRIILYDGIDSLESVKQDLIAHDWQAKLPFLHFPKIEILPKDRTIKAIAIAGGAEVAQSLGLGVSTFQEQEEVQEIDNEDFIHEIDSNAELLDRKEDVAQQVIANETSVVRDDENFGFHTIEIAADEESTSIAKISQEDRGGGQVEYVGGPSEPLSDPELISVNPEDIFKEPDSEHETLEVGQVKKTKSLLSKLRFPKINFRFPKIKRRSTPPSESGARRLPVMIISGLVMLVLIGVAGALFYWNVPKATVTLFIKRTPLTKEVSFSVSEVIDDIDFDSNAIPGSKEVIEVVGTHQVPTTGTKTVGQRAKGKIVLFNRTLAAKTFSAGTTINGKNLRFTFDQDIKVASASTEENENFELITKPSKVEVAVTAVDIGSQYNIPVNTTLVVGNFAELSFVARSVTDFSGGSSTQVAAVSAKDVENLKDTLIIQLKQQVESKILAKSDGTKGVAQSQDQEVIAEIFSAQIGEQAENLSLDMTISQVAYSYDLKSITLLAQQQVLDQIPKNYTIESNATTVEVTKTSIADDGSIAIIATTNLKVSPIINTEKIISNIVGKYPPVTESYFKSLPGYAKVESTISPSLPARLNTFPRKPENITIGIKTID